MLVVSVRERNMVGLWWICYSLTFVSGWGWDEMEWILDWMDTGAAADSAIEHHDMASMAGVNESARREAFMPGAACLCSITESSRLR